MYDCVLFDLDGTLTESAEGIINSIDYALQRMGHPSLQPEKRGLYIGPPLYDSFRSINGMSDAEAEECVRLYRERFGEIGWKENRVYRGIAPLLKTLKQNGVYLAIASAKPEIFTKNVVEYFGLAQYMDVISAGPMDKSGLPKSEIIRRALPQNAKSAVMVGDRKYDIIGAKQAGIRSIGVTYGYGTAEELTEAGAGVLCDSVESLARELLGDKPLMRGNFITFEGIDSSGKSTQLKYAQTWLEQRGWNVICTREPGGTPIGEQIRNILLSPDSAGMTPICEALLFAASRAQHTRQTIIPALDAGVIVLCDRYLDSSIAFQGGGRALSSDLISTINMPAVNGLSPDLTLYYDLSPNAARQRRHDDDRIESEQNSFHEAVRAEYLQLANAEPERIVSLDGSLDRDELFAATQCVITARLKL